MPALANIEVLLERILHILGEGLPVANLSAEALRILERLETDTARMWGMPALKGKQDLPGKCRLFQGVYPSFTAKCQQLQLTAPLGEVLWRFYLPLAQWVVVQGKNYPGQGFVLGVSGPQGSGKSTLCALLQTVLETGFKQRVVVLSLDDFYLTRSERQRLAQRVHPLFATRGVPGTHDIALASQSISSLRAQGSQISTRLPVFDKAADERAPVESWPVFQGRADILLFEGWCVGARAESSERLNKPVNSLEEKEDPDGIWRRYVNQVLGEEYSQLFRLLDRLLFLKIPGFNIVYKHRLEQEQQLGQSLRGGQKEGIEPGTKRTMNRRELQRFIMHFQRLTEYMLEELPTRADLVLVFDEQRRFQRVARR
jgi:D-glycerate 3-kinase